MSKLLTAAALVLFPMVSHAQTFPVPEGCSGIVTVQQRGCVLVNVWQCEADPEGDKWIALFGEVGLVPFNMWIPNFSGLKPSSGLVTRPLNSLPLTPRP